MTHDPTPDTTIRENHRHPGWHEVTGVFEGEIRTAWGRTQFEAESSARGLRMNMEAEHERAKNEPASTGTADRSGIRRGW